MLCRLLCLLCLPLGVYQTITCPAAFHERIRIPVPISYFENAFKAAKESIANQDYIEHQLESRGQLISPTIHSADARHFLVMHEFPKARQMDRMQEHFEGVTKYLQKRMHLTPPEVLYGIPGTLVSMLRVMNSTIDECKYMTNVTCKNSVYRTADGSCNNLDNPTWGKTFSCYRRLLPADYADGVSEIRRADDRGPLPQPRYLSTKLFGDADKEAINYTNMVTQFGEFLSHGLIRTPMTTTETKGMINCCPITVPQHPACLPIPIPRDDPFFSKFGITCLNFVRSAKCTECDFGPRNQMNQISAFIDGSQIYGNDDDEIKRLRRAGSKGLLEFIFNERAGVLLPETINPQTDQCSNITENRICFMAGDGRVNQHPGLTASHILWLQQHNNIATKLSAINPTWTDERLFQETRKIIGAQLQMVAYGEYLPVVLGPDLMQQYDLQITPPSGRSAGRTNYDKSINPTILSEFATAAYRFGHSLIRNEFKLTFAFGTSTEIQLKDFFFFPFIMYQGDEVPVMRGLSSQPAMAFDSHIVDAVSNFTYRRGNESTGRDLPALNIQRGRDHGLQPYINYLNSCLNKNIDSFTELLRSGLMKNDVWIRLKMAYEDVENVDLFSGGISEIALPGAAVGPTFGHIIALQFRNMKFGDRFYFEHGGAKPFFTEDQLAQIKRTTLAGILCSNSVNRISFLQKNLFRPASPDNPIVPCFASPVINLRPWEEVIRPQGA